MVGLLVVVMVVVVVIVVDGWDGWMELLWWWCCLRGVVVSGPRNESAFASSRLELYSAHSIPRSQGANESTFIGTCPIPASRLHHTMI